MSVLRVAEAVVRTDTGRQRRGNEDSSFARAPLFVVADGMGGAQAGEVASQLAVEVFGEGLPPEGSAEERLATRVREANRRIHRLSRSESEHAGMGTTLTAALLEDAVLAVAHVGDSRAYMFRGGSLQRLTRDHSLVGELVEQGKLTEEQAEEHPQRSIITRALGPEPDVQVDTWSYPVQAGDILLLCSDGLTSMIGEDAITRILTGAPDLRRAADRLIDEANEAGGRDNITAVLFRVEEVGDGEVDQPTMIAAPSATSTRPATAPRPPAAAPLPKNGSPEPRAPLARRQGLARPAARPRRNPRYAKPVAALVAVCAVLFLIGAGGYLATRQLYFVGTNPQGVVTVFRGLPYVLPAGIRLYETYYVSGVPAGQVPVTRRRTLLDHHLRSQKDSSNLVRALELGQLSG
ncbi:MAG TPA: Stp1/IreP family PP2C-type Ser/Thr phosphatase [Solirubrobacteraceae bacterium]|nr:Stp1/IreP family PP2C-type Ser/Thr phosphatase [Solirubrobacteraceae bacterium]